MWRSLSGFAQTPLSESAFFDLNFGHLVVLAEIDIHEFLITSGAEKLVHHGMWLLEPTESGPTFQHHPLQTTLACFYSPTDCHGEHTEERCNFCH